MGKLDNLDPELRAAVANLPSLPFDDVTIRRRLIETQVTAKQRDYDTSGVRIEWRDVPGNGRSAGTRMQLFIPEDKEPGAPGLLDVHGGGFCTGTPEIDAFVNVRIAREVGAVVVAVGYRLAPEHPFPAAVEDTYLALEWLFAHADALGIDAARIGLLGDSAGGGIAASAALFARDRGGPKLCFQALTQPVLDDRLQTQSMREGGDALMFPLASAVACWRHYLGGKPADAYSAPARMADLSGLPPTYVSVNEFDPLRDEGVNYALGLLAAGVSTELHVWPGAFHGFRIVQGSTLAKRFMAELMAVLRRGLAAAS
jgi:acetyl esterase/lipase